MAESFERRAEQMRELLRSARERNQRVVSDALSGRVQAAPPVRRRKRRKPVAPALPLAPPPPSPFPTDEAGAILRQALNRAAAVEVRWQMMFRDA